MKVLISTQQRAELQKAIYKRYPAEGAGPIAADFGVPRGVVYRAAEALGVRHYRKDAPGVYDALDAAIRERYAQEGSLTLAREFGVQRRLVFLRARAMEIRVDKGFRRHLAARMHEANRVAAQDARDRGVTLEYLRRGPATRPAPIQARANPDTAWMTKGADE